MNKYIIKFNNQAFEIENDDIIFSFVTDSTSTNININNQTFSQLGKFELTYISENNDTAQNLIKLFLNCSTELLKLLSKDSRIHVQIFFEGKKNYTLLDSDVIDARTVSKLTEECQIQQSLILFTDLLRE